MNKTIGLLAVLAVVALAPAGASAQMRGGRGSVTTAYGTFSQAEMQAAGNDPTVAAQMRQEKMEMQYMQQMAKQEQQYMQQMAKLQAQQKAQQKKNGTTPANSTATAGANTFTEDPFATPGPTRTRKKSTTKAAGKAAAKSATKGATTKGTTAKEPAPKADEEGAEADAKAPTPAATTGTKAPAATTGAKAPAATGAKAGSVSQARSGD